MDKKRCGAHTEENVTQPCKRTKCHFWQRGRTWRLHQVKQLTKKKTNAAWKRFCVESKTRHGCPDLRNRRTHRAQTCGCRGRRAWRTHWSAGQAKADPYREGQARSLERREPVNVRDKPWWQRRWKNRAWKKKKKRKNHACVRACVCVYITEPLCTAEINTL